MLPEKCCWVSIRTDKPCPFKARLAVELIDGDGHAVTLGLCEQHGPHAQLYPELLMSLAAGHPTQEIRLVAERAPASENPAQPWRVFGED